MNSSLHGSFSIRGALAIIFVASGFHPALANDLADPGVNVALQWNDAAVTSIRLSKTPPTVAARILLIAHAAMYDAWAAYDSAALPVVSGAPSRRPSSGDNDLLNKSSAVSYAAYRVLTTLLPGNLAEFNTIMVKNLAYDPSITGTSLNSPPGVGNAAAAAELAAHLHDGANQLGDMGGGPYGDYSAYKPANAADLITDPNHWQPLRMSDGSIQTFLTPFWSQVTAFALTSADQFRPSQPPQTGNWLYQQRVRDSVQLNTELDDVAKMRAEYWEDGAGTDTSPGHWNRIGQEISQRDLHNLDQDVKMFFALNAAEFDASIAVWDAKRAWDSIRPISAIRYVYNGQQLQGWVAPGQAGVTSPGAGWTPWVSTPPYPEFPSDNAAFASAGAEILKRYTGSDTCLKHVSFAAGSSKYDPGVSPASATTLGWFTFSQIAEDAQWAGAPQGIQFDDAVIQGAGMGRSVAGITWARYNHLVTAH